MEIVKIGVHRGWRYGSVVEYFYSSRRPGFDSQVPHDCTQPCVTLVPEGLTASSSQQDTKHTHSTLVEMQTKYSHA